MSDLAFILAAYVVILGGLAVYAITLRRRVRAAREASVRIRHEADAAGERPESRP